MRKTQGWAWAVCAAMAISGASIASGADSWGLTAGKVELKSAGPMAFGPEGILIVGDTQDASLVAIATDDVKGEPSKVSVSVEKLNEQLAGLFGVKSGVRINDMVVNPLSGGIYLSVTVAEGKPAIVHVDAKGALHQLDLSKARSSRVSLPNPPEDKVVGEGPRKANRRAESITDLAYVEGKVIVAGLTNGPAPSAVREIVFPFKEADQGTPIEIYHGAHGRLEDNAVVRTFVPFTIGGEPSLLAGFTCTPLVKFPLSALEAGKKTRGTTVAELGNRNRPLDMIVYKKDGKEFLLMANSTRGVMKVSTENIQRPDGITTPVTGGGLAGQTYEAITAWEGVTQLDRMNDTHAVVLVQAGDVVTLKTVALP
jgi:hypothetical protein